MTDSIDGVEVFGPKTIATEEPREKAILVGVQFPSTEWSVDSSLDELERLAQTAGADVVGRITQRLDAPNPRTFVGSGKVEEIAKLVRTLSADLVVFDDELSPSQQSNLEKSVDRDVKIIDRTALILDIFALHATTKEGRLQVRLAQNQYLLPRLRGMWAHLASNRMGGGVGSRFGEGESQLEVDRRMVRKRITSINHELKHLENVRALQRESRYESGMFKVALAGYTNAGKSSLLNRLTDAEVLAYDKLFATLDSTTRTLKLPEGRKITVTDTVGFIKKLPTTLVDAFKSTLDEINGADFVLHVIDATAKDRSVQIEAVEGVLQEIGAATIPRIDVFNKIDVLSEAELEMLQRRFPHAAFVSAHTGQGIDVLLRRISLAATSGERYLRVLIPYTNGSLVSLAHERCQIVEEKHRDEGTEITLYVPVKFVPQFERYALIDSENGD